MMPLRIAVLGAGLIGRRHIETILAMPEAAELAAVADPVADPGQFDLKGAAWFTGERQMLDQVKPEAVVIATPNVLHLDQGKLCCERGIHFLMEKPVTATIAEAAALVRLVSESGVRTLVGHHRRYLAPVEDAKAVIESGKIGRLVAASVLWATRKPDDYFQTAWRTRAGGGPLLINAIHEIDMLRHLCGEIAAVGGIKSNAIRGFAVEDSAAALFRFDNGALGTLALTDAAFSPWTIEQGSKENPLFPYAGQSAYRLTGTEGSLELPVVKLWRAATPGGNQWNKPIDGEALPERYHDPYKAQLAHFQRLIRLNEAPLVSVLDGARTLAATLAIAQASETERLCAPERFTE
ncbi:MAG TPA: Gfo/Idh/MocA family oxidoreductase [Rhizomicrobium sp.]